MRRKAWNLVLSLRFKLLCAVLALFFTFAGVTTYFWYDRLTRQASDAAANNLHAMLRISNSNFGTALKDLNSVTALVSSNFGNGLNTRIFNYLLSGDEDDVTLLQYRREAEDYIMSLCNFKSYLNSLAVYDRTGNSLSYGLIMDSVTLSSQPWYGPLINGNDDVRFIPPHYYEPDDPHPSKLVFSIARPIRYRGDCIGLVVADIKSTMLNDMFSISNLNGYSMLVVDENAGEIIFPAAENAASLSSQDRTALFRALEQGAPQFSVSLHGKNCLAVTQEASLTGWTVVGFVPYENILSDFLETRTQVLLIALACGMFILLCILLSTSLVTRNLNRLSQAVAKIDQEHLSLDVEIQSLDEVGQLYRQIQFMLRSIRELIADIRRTESEKRDSEIRALQAQINPHFLYNTLNTIQFLASLQGAENIKAVSLALSSMLHVNLNREKLIPVNEEIQYLKNYLEIQEYRFTGKFTSYFSSDTTSQSALIPKLLLQPIVENALLHGIAPQDRAGILQIKFFCLDGALHIRVKDNGKGISPQLLEALSHQPERDDGSHIGIANVRARLHLLFGDAGALWIESEPNLYTIVELSMPCITKENREQYL